MNRLLLVVVLLTPFASCHAQGTSAVATATATRIVPADERTDQYLPLLSGKKVALLVNHTAVVGNTHLVDLLLREGVAVKKIFAPEHGFRGTADAGEHIANGKDAKTGLPIISLYGDHKKPTKEDLDSIDIMVFDIQDVGARFYTYISTLHYAMEACAENDKELLVLDRPNPNGYRVDGPVLKKEFASFVGLDPIPVLHGMTVAEYAHMANGEHWLANGAQCKLAFVPCENYRHDMQWNLPIAPSPNLPNALCIALYPQLCFFEGTDISVGRGTKYPFQMMGAPLTNFAGADTFTPRSTAGAKNPPHLDHLCYGINFAKQAQGAVGQFQFSFENVLAMYQLHAQKDSFFLPNNFFDKLCGTDAIRLMIQAGKSEAEITASYQADLKAFKDKRRNYLLYPDFE